MVALGGRRAIPLGRVYLLLPALDLVVLMMQILELAMEPEMVFWLVARGLFLVLVTRLVGWEAWVDVLRDEEQLLPSSGSQAGHVGILERSVLIQSAADEVCAVWQFWRSRTEANGSGGSPSAARARALP